MMRSRWIFALFGAALLACGPKLEQRLLSDDEATRASALESVKALSEEKRGELVPVLVGQLDTTRKVSAPDDKGDLGSAVVAQAESTLRAQEIRRRALAALRVVGAPSVTPLVAVVADGKQRPWVRADVVRTLGELGEAAKPAEPALERAFAETKDERLKLQSAAALVLLGRRDADYIGELERCSTRCDVDDRQKAAEVLVKARR